MYPMLLKPIIAHRQKEALARGDHARSVRRRPGDQPAPQRVVCKDEAVARFLDTNARTSDPRDRLAVSASEGRPRRALWDRGDAAAGVGEGWMAQLPIMQSHDGGDSEAGKRWDARAEYDVGLLLARYLHENPAPSTAQFAQDLERWSQNLRRHGQSRLQELGQPRLRAL